MRILNKDNAATILRHECAHDFMSKGGTKITGTGFTQTANPELSFIANKIMANGGSMLSSSGIDRAPESMAKLHYDTNELSHGSKENFDPVRAAEIVKKAEQEIVRNKFMANAKINY